MSTSERPAPDPGAEQQRPGVPPAAEQGNGAPPYPAPPYPAPPYSAPQYPAQPYPGQPYPTPQYPGQPYPGQPYSAPPYPAQPYPAQPPPGAAPPSPFRPVPPPRDRRTAWFLVGVFAVAEVVFVLASVLVLVAFSIGDLDRPEGASVGADALVTALVVPTVLAALTAAAGAWSVTRTTARTARAPDGAAPRRGIAAALSARWSWRDLGIGLALGVGGLVITLPASYLWASAVGEDQATSAVGEAFGDLRLGPAAAVLVFLAVWLVAPLCEEVLYRGVLWGALERFGWGRWVVFAVTTLVFAVAHLELLRTPLLIVVSVPIGLARLLTGNLLASVVAHQANNFLPALGLALLVSGGLPA